MCNLLDLNDDCLLEIVKKLTLTKDRLSLFVVSTRFMNLFEVNLSELTPHYLYDFLRTLDPKLNWNGIEWICSFITELYLGEIDLDTLEYFAINGKYFTKLEKLSLRTFNISLGSEEYVKLEQVLMPIFGRLKELHLFGRKTNLIGHSKNMETARLRGQNMFDDNTFATFLNNNQNTLQRLGYRGESSLKIYNDEVLKNLSEMKCLKALDLRIYRSDDYMKLMNAIACGNTVEHLELHLGISSDNLKDWPLDFGPAMKMTSLKTFTLSRRFHGNLENFSISNLPNLRRLNIPSLFITIKLQKIRQLLKELPLLEVIYINSDNCELEDEDMLKIEGYLAEQDRKFSIYLTRDYPMGNFGLNYLTIK